jgi:hypothetical protein
MKAISRPVFGFHLGEMFMAFDVRVSLRTFEPSRFET